jgi:hypothetical protein
MEEIKRKEFGIRLGNEVAEFINAHIKKYGDFVDSSLLGGGLTFTDFYKHLKEKYDPTTKESPIPST